MNITATIDHISEKMREWKGGEKGPLFFISGTFSDGKAWDLGVKPENKDKRLAELKELIGKEGQFVIEEGREYQGQMQYKLKEWPGKPAAGGGGGFGGGGGARGPFVPRYRDTEQGTREERDSIHRSVALQEAVAMAVGSMSKETTNEIILEAAEQFYKWLSTSPGRIQQPPPAPKGPEGPPGPPAGREPSRGSTMEIVRDKITKAIKEKDEVKLKAAQSWIVEQASKSPPTFNQAEVLSLELLIEEGKKQIASSLEYDRWEAEKRKKTVLSEQETFF